jgi:16S rRNA (guanine527-N7)-methyltransferase
VLNIIEDLLPKALSKNGYEFSPTLQQQFIRYLELLQRWNQVFNLTAIRDPKEMVWLHILDSLSINPFLQGERTVDVGTGAGLPGIPLAIINPDKHFVLLDSNSKKTRFLTQAIHALGLKNVEVIHGRCEVFKPLEKFDNIVSRAFSAIAVMLATTEHLLKPGGQFLAMKGVFPEQELQEVPAQFIVTAVHKLEINGLVAERHVVCIKKKEEV